MKERGRTDAAYTHTMSALPTNCDNSFARSQGRRIRPRCRYRDRLFIHMLTASVFCRPSFQPCRLSQGWNYCQPSNIKGMFGIIGDVGTNFISDKRRYKSFRVHACRRGQWEEYDLIESGVLKGRVRCPPHTRAPICAPVEHLPTGRNQQRLETGGNAVILLT
jgi:hypothetical protein